MTEIPRNFSCSSKREPLSTLQSWLPVCLWLLFWVSGNAQTVTLDNANQSYSTLTNTTVTMTGRSELRVTASATPLSGCTINLNSPDSWFFLTNIRPSVVNSTYLPQVKVNGSNAVHGGNVRVVEYGNGTVVIPHAPSFQPFQAWSSPLFTGTTASFGQYTYYNSAAALGALNKKISSFKLKRGYMATVSTKTNGAGTSKNYVAQDGDLEIAVLPAELNNAIQFVRVFPWRWISKKGTCDTSADTFAAGWRYNWDNTGGNAVTSTLDREYVPIRQQRYWPALPDSKPDTTHLLGFNEPDNPVEDSYTSLDNGSTDTAVAVWPELLGPGLRVGSPACTDGGKSWLYSFMSKANSAGTRVDFVAIHNYQCGNSATSLYNWLKDIYDTTGKPIWLTEFNNGANWTGCGDPTQEQNAAAIASFIDMLDNAPFIERYAIYSNVEAVRQLTDSSGVTPTGAVYRDNASPVGYTQAVPSNGMRGVVQLPFENNAGDTSGFGNNGLAANSPTYAAGVTGQALVMDGTRNYVQLPAGVANSAAFSFAGWVFWDGTGGSWQRIFDFGTGLLGSASTRFMYLSPSAGSGKMRFCIRNTGAEQILETAAALPAGSWQHVAVTLSGSTVRIYLNGVQAASSSAFSINPSQFRPDLNYLGKSRFPADPLFKGKLDEVRISDSALTAAQVAALFNGTNPPPQFATSTIAGAAGTQGTPYAGTLSSQALDPGDTLTFTKLSGPAWLAVAANGTLSGTPGYNDEGPQEFVVIATDSIGGSAYALLTIPLPVVLGNGVWTANADGTWNTTTNWNAGFPANGLGSTADFSTLNITADRTVTLDASRTIGSMKFSDTTGSQAWTLTASGGSVLNLAVNDPASPVINVATTAKLNLPLAGDQGFTKNGSGTFVLGAANTLSRDVVVGTSSTASDGILRAAHPAALSTASTLQILSNNAGSSTLELDATAGNMTLAAPVTLSGRSPAVPAVRNLSGVNTLAGALSVGVGGGNYILQSDAGTLNFAGGLTSAAGSTRTFTFQGAGNFLVNSAVSNGTATNINLLKTGGGMLTLSGVNTYTGSVSINGGTLAIAGGSALSNTDNVTLANTAGAQLVVGAAETIGSLTGGGSAGGNVSLNAVLTTGGDNTSTTFSGALSGTGGLTKAGTGTMTLTGNNSFTGPVSILGGGALGVPSIGNALGAVSQIGLGGGGLTGTLLYTGSGETTSRVFALTGGFGSPGAVIDQSGTGLLKISSNLSIIASVATTLTLQGSTGGSGEISGVIPGGSATVSLAKTGSGKWTLSAANTYTGATSVAAGTLAVNGSIAAGSAVTVATGATLTGTGTVSGSAAFASGSKFRWSLASDAVVAEKLTVGTVTTASGAAVDLAFNDSGSTVDFTSPFWDQTHHWTILTCGGMSGSFTLGTLGADSFGRSIFNEGSFVLQQSPTGLSLVFSPLGAPLPPADPAAVASPGRVSLTWSAVPGALFYQVLRSSTPGGPYTAIATGVTGTSYVDLSVSNGAPFFYVFSTTNSIGESDVSAEITAFPHAPSVVNKADNLSNLDQPSSWTGGFRPNAWDTARWTGLAGPNTVLLGSDTALGGIVVGTTGGAVTVAAGNTLAIGSGGIDLGVATQNLTINSGVALLPGSQAWNVAAGRTLALGTGVFSRNTGAALNLPGAGTVACGLSNDSSIPGSGILGTWATVGTGANTRYATVSGGILAAYTGTAAANMGTPGAATGTSNFDVAAVTGNLGNPRAANTLRYTGVAATQGIGSGNTNLYVMNGLMNAGSGALVISQTAGLSGIAIGNAAELSLAAASAGITVTAPIYNAGATTTGTTTNINNGSTASSVTVTGPGSVTLSAANLFTGGVNLPSGTLAVGNNSAAGSGTIVLSGGTLKNTPAAVTLGNSISVTNATSSSLAGGGTGSGQNFVLNGNISGSGNLNLSGVTGATRLTLGGNNSGYTGTATISGVNVMLATSNAGSASAAWVVNQGLQLSGPGPFLLGSLSGSAVGNIGNIGSGAAVLTVGATGASTTYDGTLTNAATSANGNNGGGTGTLSLTKTGTGTLTLTAAHSYTGPTAVNSGGLIVTGSLGGGAVSVANAATLGGTGTLAGPVTVQSGGKLTTVAGAIGTLTLGATCTLQGDASLTLKIHRTSATADKLVIAGTFTRAGTLSVSNISGTLAAGDSFDLFDAPSVAGAFAGIVLPSLDPGLQWNTGALDSGVISVEAVPSSYAVWKGTRAFPEGMDGASQDPDGDGMSNALEWLLGSDPLVSDIFSQPAVQTRSGVEIPGADPAKRYLTLTARVRKSYTGATLAAQTSPSLDTLNAAGAGTGTHSFVVTDLGDFEIRTWVADQAVEDSPEKKAFMRLKVTTD